MESPKSLGRKRHAIGFSACRRLFFPTREAAMKTKRKRKLQKVGGCCSEGGSNRAERSAKSFHRGFSAASIPIGQPRAGIFPLSLLPKGWIVYVCVYVCVCRPLSPLLVTFFTSLAIYSRKVHPPNFSIPTCSRLGLLLGFSNPPRQIPRRVHLFLFFILSRYT